MDEGDTSLGRNEEKIRKEEGVDRLRSVFSENFDVFAVRSLDIAGHEVGLENKNLLRKFN
jgi:hypothetical protein